MCKPNKDDINKGQLVLFFDKLTIWSSRQEQNMISRLKTDSEVLKKRNALSIFVQELLETICKNQPEEKFQTALSNLYASLAELYAKFKKQGGRLGLLHFVTTEQWIGKPILQLNYIERCGREQIKAELDLYMKIRDIIRSLEPSSVVPEFDFFDFNATTEKWEMVDAINKKYV